MPAKRPLPFAAGDTATLICVGITIDLLHARLLEPDVDPAGLSRRDAAAVPRGRTVVVRFGVSPDIPVPGELFDLQVEHAWRFGHTDYLRGTVLRCWLDLDRVGVPPLGLQHHREWTLAAWLESQGLDEFDLEPAYDAVVLSGTRREVEIEQVLPDPLSPLELEEDAIYESIALREMGDSIRCEKILSELTRQDLRCIDAHAHLGNLYFEGFWGSADLERARRHYQVGVAIAERTLDPSDVTAKGWLDNRPYIRVLHGLGLAAWALGDTKEAERLFDKLLMRDPSDGTGARFLVQAVRDGVAYEEYDG
jgi:hypothetical protein